MELISYCLDCLSSKGSSIRQDSLDTGYLAGETLYQVADSHPTGNGVRIYYQVRSYSFPWKRHIFLSISHSQCPFLPMSRCEFVTDLRNSDRTHFHFHKLLTVEIVGQHYLVYYAVFRSSQSCARIFLLGNKPLNSFFPKSSTSFPLTLLTLPTTTSSPLTLCPGQTSASLSSLV